MPCTDDTPAKQGSVILIALYDNTSNTIKPQLQTAGGNPSHILLLLIKEGI